MRSSVPGAERTLKVAVVAHTCQSTSQPVQSIATCQNIACAGHQQVMHTNATHCNRVRWKVVMHMEPPETLTRRGL